MPPDLGRGLLLEEGRRLVRPLDAGGPCPARGHANQSVLVQQKRKPIVGGLRAQGCTFG